MPIDPRAGTPAMAGDLVDVDAQLAAYHDRHPEAAEASQRMAFGPSGQRGCSLRAAFNDDHIAAVSQAICGYRAAHGTNGPLFVAATRTSHPIWGSCLENPYPAKAGHVEWSQRVQRLSR